MNNQLNPFVGRGAVPLVEFLDHAADWQHDLFQKRCSIDSNFDWQLKVDGQLQIPGKLWQAEWSETGSRVAPYVVLNDKGEPLFIRPCVEFGVAITVVPLRLHPDTWLEVGVVFQARPFAATVEHPDCRHMAGLPRGFVESGESLIDAARREVREEMCHHIVGEPIPLTTFNTDASYLPTHFPAFAAWVGERDLALKPDTKERILDIRWYPVDQLLGCFKDGVTVEDFGQRGQRKVNWTGAVEWFPLMLAIPRVPQLAHAWSQACDKVAAVARY